MRVLIPSPLHSYTRGVNEVEGSGETLAELLDGLDARYPGLRFRIVDEQDRVRPHIKFFVGGDVVREIEHRLRTNDEVQIVCSLSGG